MAVASRLFRSMQRNRIVALLETLGLLSFMLVVLGGSPAAAYEFPTGTFAAPVGDSTSVTYPGGVTVTVASTGLTDVDASTTLGARGFDVTHFTPTTMVTSDTAAGVTVNTGSCASTGTCPNLGTVTVSFSQPVQNPTIHLAGLGGAIRNGNRQSDLHSIWTLTSGGATLSERDGNANFAVAGNVVTAANHSTSASCTTAVNGGNLFNAAATAACGSVQVTGTVSQLTFALSAEFTRNANASSGAYNAASSADGVSLAVTLPQDFGDAPASYDGALAAAHTLSDLLMYGSIDEDNPDVRNATTSPNAGAGASGDDNAALPDPDSVAQPGYVYSAVVPLSGVSKSARLCGWIDFDLNGTFDADERACASPAAGATSATLTFTTPSDVVAGNSYARFRLGYTAAQVESPTGRADSGEVEDFPIALVARPTIVLRKTTLGASGGPFGFTLTNTTQAAGTVTTSSAGTPTQVDGNTGTAGIQAFTVTSADSPATITESSLPSGWSLATATCTNAGGTTVGSLSGATYTIPGANLPGGAVITCTFSNGQPAISLTKTAGAVNDVDGNGHDVGDTIPYSFLVTNTGQVPLSSVSVSDPKVSGVSCPSSTLAAGASMTCTATYTLTQADVNAGQVANTATVSGTPPTGPAVTASSSTTRAINRTPAITLNKQSGAINDPDGNGHDVGDTVPYTFLVTNTGNVTVTGLSITDAKVGSVSCPVTTLAPGASTTCTATYALTQADVDAGQVTNTATANGSTTAGPVTATDNDTRSVNRSATLTLVKTAGVPSGNTAGSTIAYSFLVTNTGNVTLTSVNVTDPKVGTVTCPVTTLAPGASTTCTASYTITQADVDAGQVANTATATGTPPAGVTAPTATSSATRPLTRTPGISVDKQTAGITDLDGNGQDVGDTIAYSFVVLNTGNVTLTGVTVSDPTVGPVTCPVTTLAPGVSTTCTKTYTLTQADVDAGHVANTATVTGTPPSGLTPPTGTDSTDTTVTPGPAITIDKQAGTPSGNTAGSTILYTFIVTNSGNVTLSSVGVSDPKVGPVTCPTTTLAPGASTTCTKSYTLTQADVDSGSVTNTATASGTSPTGTTVSATDSTTTTITRTSTLAFDKTAGTPTGANVGSTITYTFTIQNTGNVTLTNVGVTDPKVGSVTCLTTTLAPGASTTCTATYALTQTDIDSGHVPNTATASGTPPAGVTPPTATDSTDTPITRTATISFDKQTGGITDVDGNGQDAGDTIAYSFLVTNTGNVTLTGLTISDPQVGPVTCAVTTLAPGATTTCTKTYTLTQADVDAGHVANTATATATPPAGVTPPSATDNTDTPVTPGPAITLDKAAGTPSGATAGSTIAYTFVVTNSGNVTLTSVNVADPKVGAVTCPATTLAPGASTTCTATYTLTQADVDAGSVVNTATATGTPPTGSPVAAVDSVTTPITRSPAITLDKQAGTPSGSTAGSTILYSFVVTNSGNVTLTSVGVADSKVGTLTCPSSTLAPAATMTCTATYTLTQADVDAGHVANSATASGTSSTGSTVTATDTTDTPIAAGPAITVAKSAGAPSGSSAGSTILYTFVVTNTGNVTLTSVGVSDPKVGPVTCPVSSLAPGASTTCTKSYTITQADVDAGVVNNTATATGTPPTGPAVTDDDSVSTPLTRSPSFSFDKSAGTPSGSTAGSTILYTFSVTNTGNVTLSGLSIADPMLGAIACAATTLAPGASTTCTKSYTLTQADVDAGHVANSATATITPPGGPDLTATDTTDTPIAAGPAITVAKSAGAPSGSSAGSTILYTFVVTNTGNVTLTSVGVSDPKVGPVTCPVSSLAPGASTTCTKSYTITQADVDAGVVNNTATATGTPPTGPAVTDDDSVSTPLTRSPSFSFDKSAGTPSGSTAGSTILYTFSVTNTGNVTLSGLSIADPMLGAITCAATTLAPGASTTCTKSYTLTQADVDAGHVANSATATITPPGGPDLTATDTTDTPIAAGPAITVAKSAGAPSGSSAGSTILYTFVVTNTGNVTLTSVGVSDPKVGPVTCPVSSLAPGASTTCTKSYTITQADVDAGVVNNTATATGTPPTGPAVTDDDSVSTPLTRTPAIALDKQGGTPTGATPGSTIPYTFLVTNTGNVTLTGVTVTDAKVGTVTCPATTLAPGATTTCTGTYTLTQTDIDAGHVANSASVRGTPPTGPNVTATDNTDVAIPTGPAILLDKVAGTPTGNTVNSTIPYTFVVTNTGNVTLTGVSIADPKVGAVSCPSSTLAPGATMTCTATYTLSLTDVNAGTVANTATATGNPPTGPAVTSTDSTTTPIPATPSILLDKQSSGVTDLDGNGTDAGDTVAYVFVVTNTGNVTLSNGSITDPIVTNITCPVASLPPGGSTTCHGDYTLTQADIDAGSVSNTAIASGDAPSGATVTAQDTVVTPLDAEASITLNKTAGAVTDVDSNGPDAGDTIVYSFEVTNSGTVTLDSIAITDPKVGAVSCPDTTLAPGEQVTCTATYTLTNADLDAGVVVNSASVSGTPPSGTPVGATDSTSTNLPRNPAIVVDKQAGAPTGYHVGDTITYTFLLQNTGNVTLSQVGVVDPKVGAVSCPSTTLAAGAIMSCSATYTLTQADVDSGHVANSAVGSGLPPTGPPAVTGEPDTTDTPLYPTAALTLLKEAGAPSGNEAGDTIDYTFTVTNTGDVTLTDVVVTDPLVGAVACPSSTVSPGSSVTCTASYTLTQADVDAGVVDNTATATGTPPSGPDVTDDSSTSTTIDAEPAVSLDKQVAGVSGDEVGDIVDYTFEVSNTGNVTLDPVVVDDPTVGPVDCPVTVLAPGDTTTCTASYPLTQTDVDSGHVANTATVTGTPPTGADVTATDGTDLPITAGPAITLVKTAAAPTGNEAGDTIDYTFLVTNTGNVTLTAVVVDDPQVGAVSCPVTTLAPDEQVTCTASYTLTQADVDAGVVDNTATVSGTPPTGADVTDTDSTSTVIVAAPAVTILKQSAGVTDLDGNGPDAGDTIDYTMLVTNTGNVTLDPVTVDDPTVGPVSCPATSLVPGGTLLCSVTYTVTQADADAGSVDNTATVAATPPTGPDVTDTSSVTTPVGAGPAITIDKTAGAPSGNDAGDTIAYTFVVTNSGTVTLTDVVVDDPKVGAVSCPDTTLLPGEQVTCTATYTLTQADVDAGSVVNTATATGTPPTGPDVTATDGTTTPLTRSPAIAMDKSAGTPSGNTAGSTVDYTFTVTNTGNVTLDPVVVDDPTVGPVVCPVGVLAPGATTTCTATYALTQTDVDAGHVANTATAYGNPPGGDAGTTADDVAATDDTDVTIGSGPSITLAKTAGAPSGSAAGDTIAYSFTVTNTGNVTLDPVSVDDPLLGGPVSCSATSLAPGASTTCGPVTYTLTQADVDAGVVDNTATATGTPPSGPDVTDDSSTSTTIDAEPAVSLDKQVAGVSGDEVGDIVDYTFEVSNTGNVTLDPVVVDDPTVGPVDCPVTVLAPGDTTTCTASYPLTQTDVDSGHVANTATVTGTPPTGADVTATDGTDLPITAGPAITLVKTAAAPTGNEAGDTIDYTFLVTNTGNVTLTAVVVDDPQVGAVSCPVTTLAPDEQVTCTASYTLTQADVDAGVVDNTATVSGTPPTGADVTDTDSTSTVIVAAPAVTILKQSAGVTDLDGNGPDAGDTIDYTMLVTNTGNVTLDPVTVDDPTVGPVSCPATSLVPGGTLLCSVTYTVTQADADAGSVDNTATVAATPPTGPDVTDTSSVTTPVGAGPAITIDKTAGAPSGNDAGDTIAYTFVVTNSGTVTLTDVVVDDPKVGAVSCPDTTLLPGEQVTCTATYTLTQADVDAGSVVNTATATGTPPTGPDVTATDGTTTPLTRSPAIAMDKSAGTPSGNTAGSTVDYTFTVTNTGNVTLDPVVVDDPTVGPVVCPVGVLAPGATTTCTATYALTQTDVDAGHVANTATAYGNPPGGDAGTTADDVAATDDTDVTIGSGPSITLAKTAGAPSGSAAGDTIAYSFTVTNTGNVTLDPVSVDDPLLGGPVSCSATSLAPGASTTCGPVTYTLTQADVDAGVVDNTATATGTAPDDSEVTDDASTSTPIPAAASIELDKTAGTLSGVIAGSTIDYTFQVTNSGNVTLDPVVVDDPTVGPVDCPVDSLAPGDSTTCTATYTLTQADVNAGHIANTATAFGNPPDGDPLTTTDDVSATDNTDTAIPAGPALVLDKQAAVPSGTAAGDTIDYTFVVRNVGNVSLDPVSVDDPLLGGPVPCPAGPLAPGASMTCGPVTYTLTQADVDAGVVDNTATATGTPPTGPDVSDDDSTSTLLDEAPSLILDKQAGAPSGNTAGESIVYTFEVTNTGNVTLDPVTVDDPLLGGPLTCPAGPLAPGATVTCDPVTYLLTQSDVDAGHVANSATATGTSPGGTDVTSTDGTDVTIDAGPALTLDKQAGDPTGDTAGETIDYTFVVTNVGNVTLDPVVVDDPKVGAVSCPVDVLAPGATTTCTATYTLTQDDIDAGTVDNLATAFGNPPAGDPATTADDASATDATTTPLVQQPAITLDKQAGVPSGSGAGDTIDYTFEVTNTGNVTLDPISVQDPLVGAVDCPLTSLAPGEVATCTATYTLTQADVDAGTVDNVATAFGNPPGGDPVDTGDDVSDVDTTSTPIPAAPAIDLVKTGSADGTEVGDLVEFTFEVTNTGNVTLDPVVIDDPLLGAVDCPLDSLAPGDQMTCAADYVITQADVDAGLVHNEATAIGTPPSGADVTATDTVDVPLVPGPAIALDKQAGAVIDTDGNGTDAGDTIDYTFLVTNTGNVTLSAVTVSDPKIGAVTCPASMLAPDEAISCTATYTLTQADVDAGSVVNTADVTGTPPTGPAVSDEDTVTTRLDQTPAIELVKTADATDPVKAGDKIRYTFTVTNTGNITLTHVRVSDPKLGPVTCADTTLAPGESTTCRGPAYTVTADDVARGSIRNHAVARGDGGPGAEVSDDDVVTVRTTECRGGSNCQSDDAILLHKRADTHGPVRVGDAVTYSFVVTNIGNRVLRNVKVSDPMLGEVTCPKTTLEPGESMTCHAPPYVVTAQDVDRGEVVNHATASARSCRANGTCARVTDGDRVTISSRTGGLPDTGSPIEPGEFLLALAMLVAGGGLVVAGRRRRG